MLMSQMRKLDGKASRLAPVSDHKIPRGMGRPFGLVTTSRAKTSSEAVKIARLTKREREIIILVSEGLKNKEIAARLCISAATVRHHLSSIFAKLDVPNRLKLMVYAYRHELADLPE
jgi:DNA-binding NarL/FixJ family response regulator